MWSCVLGFKAKQIKAFDSVDHKILLSHLSTGQSGNFLEWFKSHITNLRHVGRKHDDGGNQYNGSLK